MFLQLQLQCQKVIAKQTPKSLTKLLLVCTFSCLSPQSVTYFIPVSVRVFGLLQGPLTDLAPAAVAGFQLGGRCAGRGRRRAPVHRLQTHCSPRCQSRPPPASQGRGCCCAPVTHGNNTKSEQETHAKSSAAPSFMSYPVCRYKYGPYCRRKRGKWRKNARGTPQRWV